MHSETGDHNSDEWVAKTTAGIARGDRAALAVFYEAWFDRCYALARSLTRRDEAFCLDIVQDSMLRVIRSLPRLETRAQLEAWMTKAVHSAALDQLRREARRLKRETAREGPIGVPPDMATNDLIQTVMGKLHELPADDRTLVSLRFAQGRSLHATGAATGTTGDAAHGRVRRALEKLRRLVMERDHD